MMADCVFRRQGDLLVCEHCPRQIVWPESRGPAPRANCSRQAEPGLLRQAWNYSAAVTAWMLAGSPTRSQAEIDRLLAVCQACPHFASGARPHCRLCGCSLNSAPDGLMNKIAMATESCPDSPPRWTAQVSVR